MPNLIKLLSHRYCKRLLTALFLLILWQLIYQLALWPPYLLPSPYDVWQTLIKGMTDTTLLIATVASMKRLLIGYILAVIIGSILGFALATFRFLEETIGFFAISFQTIPSIVWLPLAILWFGLSDAAVIFVIVIGSLWTTVLSVKTAIQNVSPLLINVGRTLGRKGFSLFFQIIIPASMPTLITGLRLAWAFAWRSLIAGELLGSGIGLGQILMVGRNFGDMSLVLTIMFIIALIGAILDLLLFRRLENNILRKWGHLPQDA